MSRAAVAIVALLFVTAVGIMGFQAALADAGEDQTIDSEEWTPDPGNVTQLEYSGLPDGYYYESSVEVYTGSNNKLTTEGEDYEWNNDNGTIYTIPGGELDGETTATITYTFNQISDTERSLAAIVSHVPEVAAALFPLLGVALLLIILRG